MRAVKICVTADDIAKGSRQDSGCCPIALAAERAGIDEPAIGLDAIEYTVGRWGGDPIGLPGEAVEFVRRFDAGETVAPFEFDVEVETEDDIELRTQLDDDRGEPGAVLP